MDPDGKDLPDGTTSSHAEQTVSLHLKDKSKPDGGAPLYIPLWTAEDVGPDDLRGRSLSDWSEPPPPVQNSRFGCKRLGWMEALRLSLYLKVCVCVCASVRRRLPLPVQLKVF